MIGKCRYFNWNGQPALSDGSRAWALAGSGTSWTEVDPTDIYFDAWILPSEAIWRRQFAIDHPELPPLPEDTLSPAADDEALHEP